MLVAGRSSTHSAHVAAGRVSQTRVILTLPRPSFDHSTVFRVCTYSTSSSFEQLIGPSHHSQGDLKRQSQRAIVIGLAGRWLAQRGCEETK